MGNRSSVNKNDKLQNTQNTQNTQDALNSDVHETSTEEIIKPLSREIVLRNYLLYQTEQTNLYDKCYKESLPLLINKINEILLIPGVFNIDIDNLTRYNQFYINFNVPGKYRCNTLHYSYAQRLRDYIYKMYPYIYMSVKFEPLSYTIKFTINNIAFIHANTELSNTDSNHNGDDNITTSILKPNTYNYSHNHNHNNNHNYNINDDINNDIKAVHFSI